jgi:two-component system phosphate regulon response regulator PhoB
MFDCFETLAQGDRGIECCMALTTIYCAKMENEPLFPGEVSSVIKAYDLQIDLRRKAAYMGGAPLSLTGAEFRLLVFFLTHPGSIFTRQEILDHIYGDHLSCTVRAIDLQIFRLRKKLGPIAVHLETARGRGYRFNVPRST